jgi:FMN phosphatase YigB (HAD superfamily)
MDKNIKIVSFDVENTVVTTDFSAAIWFEAIPQRYANRHEMKFEEAKKKVFDEYASVGDQRSEWYDIHYWVNRFDIGTAESIMSTCSPKVSYFPEVMDVLDRLSRKYELTVASGTPHEFLHYLLHDIRYYFKRVFSSTSDDKQLKDARFFTNMCRKLKVEPGEIVHVGDNWQFDYLAAGESGIKAYYLDRAGEHKERNGLKNLSELVDLLSN